MSVNLSACQIARPEIVEEVTSALSMSGLHPQLLVLEITESVVLQDTAELHERLQTLKALGVRLAIDDFGTGYSSLAYLQRLPVDVLKIDKTFVDSLTAGEDGETLTAAIVHLAQTLRLQSVAEGVEHTSQAVALQRLQCDLGQGYLFARPLEAEEITRLLVDPSPILSLALS